MRYYLLLLASVAGEVLYNIFMNLESKNGRGNGREVHRFNRIVYSVGFVLLLIRAIGTPISLYSILLGMLFGFAIMMASFALVCSYATGPMHISTLFITSSMILPILAGVPISHDQLTVGKLICIVCLLFFLYLSLERKEGAGVNREWFVYTLIGFLFSGMIGITQKIHQASVHADESAWFLAAAFFFSAVFSAVINLLMRKMAGRPAKKEEAKPTETTDKPVHSTKKMVLYAVLCGICIWFLHVNNLTLVGQLPGFIFFPIENGGSLMLDILVAVFLFHEKLTKRQLVGIIGGVLALLVLCILP